MFGRKKDADVTDQSTATPRERAGAKNRPTPKRREAQAANRRPLVPSDRKGAAKQERARLRGERLRARQALASGDEQHFPPRDAGPVKRLIRDVVDARLGVGEVYLPFVVLLLAMMFVPALITKNAATQSLWVTWSTLALYTFILMTAIDTFVMWRAVKRALQDRFGDDFTTKGLLGYAFARSVQLRAMRRPPAVVARRQPPRP